MEPIITFPRWGNYTIAFKTIFEKLGLKVISPEKTTAQTIVKGTKIAPEMYCFPLKVNLGNYLEALEKGANTIFMPTALSGSCRLRYYGLVQDKVLKEAGYEVNFITFDQSPKDIYLKIKKISQASFWKILKTAWSFFNKLRFIEKLEREAQYLRPREIEKGITDKILNEAFLRLEKITNEKEFSHFKKEVLKKLKGIKIDEKKDVPKVGLIGEIYTLCDPTVNFEIEKKLGQQGIEVHREMDLTYHLKKKIFPWKDWQIQREINPYLKSTVGGHGRDAIYEMLNYIKRNFDGVIQLLPFACFLEDTNITIENYLQKPIQDIKVGEKVLTHKGRFKKVTHKFCRNYQGPILKIDCGGKLLTISVTPEHPILLAKTFIKNHKKQIQSFNFTPAYQAKKGDLVAIPIPLKNEIDDPVLIDYSRIRTYPTNLRLSPNLCSSMNLTSQLFWLLIRNRIKTSFMEQHIKDQKLSWMLKIANAQGIKRLNEELIKVTNRENNVWFKELKNYFLVPIRKMEWFDFKGKVYNLTVEDDHSYVANFLIAKNCMPEITVRPILEKIHQESGIPFLSLSLDEQVAETGINTRLEAFVDVVNDYHKKVKKI